MRIQRLEFGKDFLDQAAVFRSKYLHLGLQGIGKHVAVTADQFQAFDVQFFKHLLAETMQGFFLGQGGYAHVQGVQRLAHFDLRFLTGRAAKANNTHDEMCIAGQLLIDELLVHLGPVTEMNAQCCLFINAANEVLVEFFRHEWQEGREQGDQCCQALVEREVCCQLIIVKLRLPDAFATAP